MFKKLGMLAFIAAIVAIAFRFVRKMVGGSETDQSA